MVSVSRCRVGHGNAPQGTTSLEDLSVLDAADFCRQTIRAAALEWTETYPKTMDRRITIGD